MNSLLELHPCVLGMLAGGGLATVGLLLNASVQRYVSRELRLLRYRLSYRRHK